MITVVISKKDHEYQRVLVDGHAGYADHGQDIVCAAVSVLVINTFNSIESFTEDPFTCDVSPDGGHMDMKFTGALSDSCVLLLDSMVLGLEQISKQYGSEYISLQLEEV